MYVRTWDLQGFIWGARGLRPGYVSPHPSGCYGSILQPSIDKTLDPSLTAIDHTD